MQSKGVIKSIAILLVIACIYQLSFSFKTRSVEKAAVAYATTFSPEEQAEAEQYYLDSIQNVNVYDLGFISFTYKQCKEKELNLGLDLKGGMNVMLEVQVVDIVKALAGEGQNDPIFQIAIAEANQAQIAGYSKDYISNFVEAYKNNANGVSLASVFLNAEGTEITLASSDDDVEQILKDEASAAIAASFDVLNSRISNFGVAQPNIMRLPNSNRILVELPGIKEPQRVRNLLQGTASLEFWETYSANELLPYILEADQLLKKVAADSVTEEVVEVAVVEPKSGEVDDLISEIGSIESAEVAQVESRFNKEDNPLLSILDVNYAGHATLGAAYRADMPMINAYLADPSVRELFPSDVDFKWSFKGDDNNDGRFYLYTLRMTDNPMTNERGAALDGSVVTSATSNYSQRGATGEVSMTMNAYGTAEWANLTGNNINRPVAIVLDGYVYSAPNVQTKIENGSSVITGDFTIQESTDLANILTVGKVPVPSRIIQDTVVGPSLGQESINLGLISFVIAFFLVLLYMGIFYRSAGWMADIALLFNVFLLLGVLVSFGAVLTLPGIAGIVLTMGMAVDANVIIYERIKEELREGKGLSLAIKDGFAKAYSAIIDGNITTIITGIVLFTFGSGPVQGFATTLIIGIITSFFCSIFITRIFIEWYVGKFKSIKFSSKWSEKFLNNTKIDFISMRKMAYIVIVSVVALFSLSFAVRQLNFGIEFTGGRAYVVRFDKPVSAEDVRVNLAETFEQQGDEDASSVSFEVKQYGNENQMRIVTQYKYVTEDSADGVSSANSAAVDDEVEFIIYSALKPLFSYEISFEDFRSSQADVNGIITADKIDASIADDMTWDAIWSVLFSLLAIGFYIKFRFKKWQWAAGATVSLFFNAIFVIGIFSLLYGILPFNLEVNQAFIAAILTIIGYSINDTVIVFDRIREYLGLYPKRTLKDNVNKAVNATLSRTINTTGTTLVTLFAIFFFGGETIRGFVFALIVGVIIGTISTIFVATPIAYDFIVRRAKAGK